MGRMQVIPETESSGLVYTAVEKDMYVNDVIFFIIIIISSKSGPNRSFTPNFKAVPTYWDKSQLPETGYKVKDFNSSINSLLSWEPHVCCLLVN